MINAQSIRQATNSQKPSLRIPHASLRNIPAEGNYNTASASIERVTPAEANVILSEEHSALGFRPLHRSLDSQAQAAAARDGNFVRSLQRTADLKEAARVDAVRVAAE